MFETAAIAAAMVSVMKHNDDVADRRAFYGPDAPPAPREESRRKDRVPRFLRRGSNVA